MNERKEFRRCGVQGGGKQCLKDAGHQPPCQFEDGTVALEEAMKQGLRIDVEPGVDALGIVVVHLSKKGLPLRLKVKARVIVAYDAHLIKVTKSDVSATGEGVECMTEAVRKAGGTVTFSVGRISIGVPKA